MKSIPWNDYNSGAKGAAAGGAAAKKAALDGASAHKAAASAST